MEVKKIEKYLLANQCNPALKGFSILVSVIQIADKDPDLNKTGLFRKYKNESGDDISEAAAYRSVKYCLDNSLFPEKRVLPMIRTALINLNLKK